MQIPPAKKSTFFILIAVAVLFGILIGVTVVSGALRKALILDQLKNSQLTPEQAQKAAALSANAAVAGTVASIRAGELVVETTVANPLSGGNATPASVTVSFDSGKDRVVAFKKSSGGLEQIDASFGDIATGAQVLVKTFEGKKVIYILSTSQ